MQSKSLGVRPLSVRHQGDWSVSVSEWPKGGQRVRGACVMHHGEAMRGIIVTAPEAAFIARELQMLEPAIEYFWE